MLNVKDFGAIGNGKALDTSAIQAAIDKCAEIGGGTVMCDAGTYLVANLVLKSHVHLYLAPGAVLKASADQKDYPGERRYYVIVADGEEDFSIFGEGTVLGTGQEPWGKYGIWTIPNCPTEPLAYRINLVLIENCKNVSINGVTFLYSDCWTLHFRLCENVHIDHCKIFNNFFRANTDGIDPDSCKNFIISNCHIVTGDDCIVAKTTRDQPMENLVVTNCVLESVATAIKLGTESRSDFRDIMFSNCVIKNSSIGLGIYAKDGAIFERINFTNVSIECPDRDYKPVIPLYIDLEKRNQDSKLCKVRDIMFSNILIKSAFGSVMQGMPDNLIENLSLSNINVRVPHEVDFSNRAKNIGGFRTTEDDGRDTLFIRKPAYLSLAYINGLSVRDIRVSVEAPGGYDRAALYAYGIEDAYLRNIKCAPAGANQVVAENCCDIDFK